MSNLQAITTALDEELRLTGEEKSIVYSARLFDMEYQVRGERHLYTDADLVLLAAAFHGSPRIVEGLFNLDYKVNLFLHGRAALYSVISKASHAGLLSGEESAIETTKAIEFIQLLVDNGAYVEDEHLKQAIRVKNLELVQYFIVELGADEEIAVRTRVPGTEEIREWAREWKKVNKLKTKLSSSLNKEASHASTRNKI
ncbi:hypothetical protein LGM85_30235 [Burkholderia multivorans]|uniref:hypothetical protein n=1 Tax=Burkholderia multivorans TaxID=87883 RepID=UPI00201AB89A|nr:hypothetical protein [Burkholderia multivorans]MCA8488204.1 hypothetical protein [Burkholderia multivorans]MCL4663300.1 hypothetical protein [Burkholderia multivorans]MCO1414988.1 hypothetical protein [Burkholderia multivorans]MCO1448932.1 hypothetical protein [Burkholderia multivorans]MCO8315277.1 hypothetical protein [Burkholderia multivorans]